MTETIKDTVPDLDGGDDPAAVVETEGRFDWRFDLRADGVYRRVGSGDNVEWRWLCSPIEPLAMARDMDGEESALLVRVRGIDGGWHDLLIPHRLFATDGARAREMLMALGARMMNSKEEFKALNTYLAFASPAGRVRCVDSVGWHGGRFVLPRDVQSDLEEGREAFHLNGFKANSHSYHIAGTADDWRREVSALASGNSRMVLAISASFAAALLEITGDESGGFHFHGVSSVGKSATLVAAGSVWGGGPRGYIASWRMTSNALENTALAHCDTCLCLDEVSQAQGQDAAQAVYMLGNQQGKRRQSADGGARKVATWRTLFLSNGEMRLEEKVEEAGGKAAAGMSVRVIDIHADAGAGLGLFEDLHGCAGGADLNKKIKAGSKAFYGAIGREFIAILEENRDGVRDAIAEMRADFLRDILTDDMDGQVKRVLDRFSLVAAAGELVIAEGLVDWEAGEARAAAERCFNDWLVERGGIGSAETADAVNRLRNFIFSHRDTRFKTYHHSNSNYVLSNQAGFVRYIMRDGVSFVEGNHSREVDVEKYEYYLTSDVMKNEILRGLDVKTMLKNFAGLGILPDGHTTKNFKVSSLKKGIRLFRIDTEQIPE